jgi:DNA gyrase subunit A
MDIEDLIQREEMVVTVTHSGYIKRVPLTSYRAQRRGGKGRSGVSMHDDDVTTQLFVGSTHTPMLFFSNRGQVYSLKLYKLPLGNPQSKGRPLVNILKLQEGEAITNIMPMPENIEEWDNLNIMFSTRNGNIRRNDLSDFKKIQINGKIAIRMEDGDSLVGVMPCSENDHILLATRQGKAIRFPVTAVRVFKSRTSDGVRGLKLAKDDFVISMAVLHGTECDYEEREKYLSIPTHLRKLIAEDAMTIDDLKAEHLVEFKKALLPYKEYYYAEKDINTHVEGIGKPGGVRLDAMDQTAVNISLQELLSFALPLWHSSMIIKSKKSGENCL